jgi:hypothetical protein
VGRKVGELGTKRKYYSEHPVGGPPSQGAEIKAAEEAAAEAEAEHTLVVYYMGAEPKKRRPPSGFHGVYARGNQWKAQIVYGGNYHYIGTFDTKQEAALAYDTAAREHGGGKMKLNYESIKAANEAVEHVHTLRFLQMLCAQAHISGGLVAHSSSSSAC